VYLALPCGTLDFKLVPHSLGSVKFQGTAGASDACSTSSRGQSGEQAERSAGKETQTKNLRQTYSSWKISLGLFKLQLSLVQRGLMEMACHKMGRKKLIFTYYLKLLCGSLNARVRRKARWHMLGVQSG